MLAVVRVRSVHTLGRVAAHQPLARCNAVAATSLLRNGRALSTSATTMTEQDVLDAQKAWSDGVVAIGKAFMEGGDYKGLATAAASSIYGYDEGKVLFKPTRCAEVPFRPKPEEALSYFVGGHIKEDKGFAIQPWSKIVWDNHDIYCSGDVGLAMGEYARRPVPSGCCAEEFALTPDPPTRRYHFTDANTQAVSKVEYTFGYRKFAPGKVRIFLHHSSVPYKP